MALAPHGLSILDYANMNIPSLTKGCGAGAGQEWPPSDNAKIAEALKIEGVSSAEQVLNRGHSLAVWYGKHSQCT